MTIEKRSYVETELGQLAYCRAGAGPSVVLIHGSLVTADDMVLALTATLSRTYDVLAFDRPGHGGSSQTLENPGSPVAQAKMIAAGLEALDVCDPIVIGHSFGGAVALSLAAAAPIAIRGVVALAPICFPEVRLEQFLVGPRAIPIAGEMLARSFGRHVDVVSLPLLRHAMFAPQLMPRVYAESFPFAWASTPDMLMADAVDSLGIVKALPTNPVAYADISVPVRVYGGTHDLVVTNARHGYVAASLMPNAKYEWLIGGGHMIHHFHQQTCERALRDIAAHQTGERDRNEICSA